MLNDSERDHTFQPVPPSRYPGGFHRDSVPECVPGNAELVGQSLIPRFRNNAARQSATRLPLAASFARVQGSRMLHGEDCPGQSPSARCQTPLGGSAAAPATKTGNEMDPDMAASVADGDDSGAGNRRGPHRLRCQNEADLGCGDGADVDALDTEKRIRPHAPTDRGTRRSVGQARISCALVFLVGTNSKRL
jgi:hypothetical protein